MTVDMADRSVEVGRAADCAAGRRRSIGAAQLARDLLDAGDHLVDRLVDRHLLVDDAVHRLGPDVLVVEHRELVVLGELERRRAGLELVVHGLAVRVGLPERRSAAPALVTGNQRPSEPSTYGVRFSSSSRNATNSLAALLVLRVLEDHAGLHRRAVDHLASRRACSGSRRWRSARRSSSSPCARCSARQRRRCSMSSSHLAAIEIVALCVITIVLLWKATLLSGSFQLVDDGGVQPLRVDARCSRSAR